MEQETKILIVDDDDKNIRILEEVLGDRYNTLSVSSGDEALIKVDEFGPDIILLDIMMPGMDGHEVSKRIRENDENRFIKIIMISALNKNDGYQSETEQNKDDYITKPFDPDEVLSKIKVFSKLKLVEESDLASRREKEKYESLLKKLKETQDQLLQSEKMASIGQLAAGVAHEINNPVGYINSNITTLKQYAEDLISILEEYEKVESFLPEECQAKIKDIKKQRELDYLKADLQDLVAESIEGVTRVKKIVQDLKDFSHVDEQEWQMASLHKGLDSTLNIAHNEIKYKAKVIKDYQDIPDVECNISQLNQVFLNLLVNAAHAIETQGEITVRTGLHDKDWVYVSVGDNGSGIDDEHMKKIFDPFYTTKPIGKGTGLGLSLSYSIVEKHAGRIQVDSKKGEGTTFTIYLPMKQQLAQAVS